MIKKITLALAILIATTSCAPVLIGSVAYKSSKTKKQRQQFITEFNKTNLEREKAGLEPLDFCTEAYNFDRKWVKKNKQ